MRLLAVLAMVVALAGCGGATATTTTQPPTELTPQPKPAPETPIDPTPIHPTPTTPEQSTTAPERPAPRASRVEEIENELQVARESLARATTDEERNYIQGDISRSERELRRSEEGEQR
jgi:hypothetical protein